MYRRIVGRALARVGLKKVAIGVLERVVPYAIQAYRTGLDALDHLQGREQAMVPPRRLMFIGGTQFKETGEEFLSYFEKLAKLKSNDRVLDVGCGIGRMAVPLTRFLNESGSLEGFDIVEQGITWCQRNITSVFPNFRFQHADIYNKFYNKNGRLQAGQFKFPYRDAEFDFVFLTSVFTHMFPKDVEHYVAEISRVLKPGGRLLCTFLLLNEESKRLVHTDKTQLPVRHRVDDTFWVMKPKVPEEAVGLDEHWVVDLLKAHGLSVFDCQYGRWCGRSKFLSFQDIVLAEKENL